MSNQALKVKCPFCEIMFAARYAFFQHLCDKHFKETLAQQVPLHPPYQCPVAGCAYIARDSRQSLIRHYGMTHKVIVELLKQHVPNYEAIDPFPSDDHNQQQAVLHQQAQQVGVVQQHHQVYYQHPVQQQQHQFSEQDLQDPILAAYYQQEYQPQQPQQQLHLPVQQQQQLHQQPHMVYGQQQQQQQLVGNDHMRFEPQIDGTFDPSHYSDHSMDGIRSVPTTPIKAGAIAQPVMPPPAASTVDADSLLLSLAAEQETELVTAAPDKPDSALQLIKEEDELGQAQTPIPSTPATPASKGGPKVCEICGKQFEGKNRAMLKVQHMANHFKDKLFSDLKDKSAPFKCPIEGCSYQTKHKPDWARHYGSVHSFIAKYLKEYLDEHGGHVPTPTDSSSQDQPPVEQTSLHPDPELSLKSSASTSRPAPARKLDISEVTDGERTYSAFLPKADLQQILTTAMNQQSQPDKNFGVVTINSNSNSAPTAPSLEPDLGDLNFVDQVC